MLEIIKECAIFIGLVTIAPFVVLIWKPITGAYKSRCDYLYKTAIGEKVGLWLWWTSVLSD
jgi:hypothetical protein